MPRDTTLVARLIRPWELVTPTHPAPRRRRDHRGRDGDDRCKDADRPGYHGPGGRFFACGPTPERTGEPGSPSSFVYKCSPHSVLADPVQRPARGSSTVPRGRVQGAQPMER